MKNVFKIFGCLFVLIIFIVLGFVLLSPKKEVQEDSRRIDDYIVGKVSKIDRVVIKEHESEEIICEIDNVESINMVINVVKSASLRIDLYEYVTPSYSLDLYSEDIFVDTIYLYASLNEISFKNYNKDKRYDGNEEDMRQLYEFITLCSK